MTKATPKLRRVRHLLLTGTVLSVAMVTSVSATQPSFTAKLHTLTVTPISEPQASLINTYSGSAIISGAAALANLFGPNEA